MSRFTIVALLLSACVRTGESPCANDADCYVGEQCRMAQCLPPLPDPPNGAIDVGTDANHIGTALTFDDENRPQMINAFDDGSWFLTTWDGERWSSERVLEDVITDALNQTQLIRDSANLLHFTYIDRDGDLHLMSQTPNDGWEDDVVVAASEDGAPFGNSIAPGRSGQVGICYVVGDFLSIRMGMSTGRAFFARRDEGTWITTELPPIDGASPTFGCALSMDSDTNTATIGLTFIDPLVGLFSRSATSLTEPREAIDFTYDPVYVDGRVPSANSVAFDANIPATIAYARTVDGAGEVLQFITAGMTKMTWSTIELFETGLGRTIGEVNIHPDTTNPERILFYASTQSPAVFYIGWVTRELSNIRALDLPAESEFAIAAPDRRQLFHVVYSDESGLQYRTEALGEGGRR